MNRIARGFVWVMFVTLGMSMPSAVLADPPARPNAPTDVPVDLQETLVPTAMRDVAAGPITIRGSVKDKTVSRVFVRVTDARGQSTTAAVVAREGSFNCVYPDVFAGAAALRPGMLFLDASLGPAFSPAAPGAFQAEAALVLYDSHSRKSIDLPSAFTNDLLDARGRTDAASSEWPAMKPLVNLYMHSRAAELTRIRRDGFDLARPQDLQFFKNQLSLYEFDYRDRDWSSPLGHRVSRTLWQAAWDRWFNASNDHPLDGNPANTRRENYRSYMFTNDFADLLVTYLLRPRDGSAMDDNLDAMCNEGIENLLSLQHRTADNFAQPDAKGRDYRYTGGAFRYGMFENGDFLTEGTGWFYDPDHSDYIEGGVFNGRATWALGVALQRDPKGPLANRLKEAIALSVKFCLRDAVDLKYAKRTKQGNVYWRDVGEHAYLLLGMIAACSVAPDLPIANPKDGKTMPLKNVCAESLNALVDLKKNTDQWSVYPNVDSVAIAALADGVAVLGDHPDRARWLETARQVADAWIAAKVDPTEYKAPLIHFGPRIAPDTMTFNWRHLSKTDDDWNRIHLYKTGHWIHALADLYALAGDQKYRVRCDAMVSYLCGANPWRVRLFNELGAVYNWLDDLDRDGVEDTLRQDLYPESTAFCQIGILRYAQSLVRSASPN